ncbi:methyltransferase [Methylomonas sp. 2BW1-5-20]|uniref:methyltransferase n=1 Tax=Methylomonas sp. 2BW1-5-20 TaxID=3376686 RepID=UPI004053076A
MTLQMNTSAVRRFSMIMKFGSWLQNIPNKLTPPPFWLMQIGSAFWQSRALYVAAQLDIASVIADGELSSGLIASKVSANPDAVFRLLRMLQAMGIFEETAPSVFKNNKVSVYLRKNHPNTVRAMILMHNSEAMSRPWFEKLEQGVREGTSPFQLTHDEELFDFMDNHREFDQLFSEAMDSVEALTGDSFATDFDWSQFDRIIDVGGSRGAKSLTILKRYPHLTAVVVDRPQVIAEARQYWEANPSADVERIRFQGGDLLRSVPAAEGPKDIYLLSAVLHGFDYESSLKALRNLAQAIGTKGARIALMEIILPEIGTDLAGASLDMQMFMGCRGRERTLKEWTSLINAAGLKLEEVVGLQSFGSILVVKAS